VADNVLGGGNVSTPTIQAYGSTGTEISPATLAAEHPIFQHLKPFKLWSLERF
jgi:hypothetical protein